MLYKIVIACVLFLTAKIPAQTDTIAFKYKHKTLPFGLLEKVPQNMPEIALALSGGGSRGAAQIGVIKALMEAEIPFSKIVGTSMGSVVGGLLSAGYSTDEIDSIFKDTNWDELISAEREGNRRDLFVDQKITEDKAIFNLRLKGLSPVIPTSINDGQKLANYLNLLVLNAPVHQSVSFDQLKYSFRSVCTDLKTGLPVVLDRGSLSLAMRASSSVTFLLSPVKIDSLILVDGGLVANIPAQIAEGYSDYVIAVNTTSGLHSEADLDYPWFVADQVVSIPMKLLNEDQLKHADAVITPALNGKTSTDFTSIDSLISAGYRAGTKEAENINLAIDSIFISNLNQPERYYKKIKPGNKIPPEAKAFVSSYAEKDSVSNYRIYKDLFRLQRSGRFKEISVEMTKIGDSSVINYVAEQSPLIKNININNKSFLVAAVEPEPFSELLNTPFDPSAISEYFIESLKKARQQGYSLADVENIYFSEETGTLHIQYNEGFIDSILITGNTYTNSGIIIREFPLNQGDYFRVDMVDKWLTNLRSTNLFDDINITIQKEQNKNILVLRVVEKNSSVLRVGFRIDNENKMQAGIDIRDENLLGSGTELGLLLSAGARNRNFILEHKSNRIFRTYLTYKINAYYMIDDAYYYTTDPQGSINRFSRAISGEHRQVYYGASLSLGTQVGRFGNFIFTGKYQYDELKNKTGTTVDPYKSKIVSLRISSTIDTQDKYPYPDKGMYFTGWYETAQKVLGGEVSFSNISFDYKYHLTLNEKFTFIPRTFMGFGDNTLPVTQMYSLGGQNSFLGMRKDEYRGRQVFLSSLESRYKLPFSIFFESYFRLRYDLGSIWEVLSQIRFKDLKHGVGATLSIDSPVGPADFSIGRSFLFVNRGRGTEVSLGEVFLYFSIGFYY